MHSTHPDVGQIKQYYSNWEFWMAGQLANWSADAEDILFCYQLPGHHHGPDQGLISMHPEQ
jgi:hypothetical protein